MKKLLTVFLSLLIISTLSVNIFAAGLMIDGKEPDLFIRNENDLVSFSEDVKNGTTFDGKLIVLSTNIDITKDLLPIGDAEHSFEGTFDGRGYYVSFTLKGKEDKPNEPTGLFAVIGENGVVRNLNVTGSVQANGTVGGVAGINNGLIENCLIRSTVTGGDGSSVGFVCGENNGKVFNCFVLFRDNEGKIVGSGDGETVDSFNKKTAVNISLQTMKKNVSENGSYVDWFWGWNGFPMFTREHGAHTYVNVDEIPATCRYSGQKKGKVCTVCGQIGGGCTVIPATGIHNPIHVDKVDPTCTEAGHEEGEICAYCGVLISGLEEIAPSHAEPEYVAEVPPTATEDGVSEGHICPRCGEHLDGFEPIPATGEPEVQDEQITDEDDNKDDAVEDFPDGYISQETAIFGMIGLGLILIAIVAVSFVSHTLINKKRS